MTDRFVIIGASAAGVAAAMTLRDHGYSGEVVLLSGEDRLPYERPDVSKGLLQTGIATPIFPHEAYAERRIDLRLNTPATRIDPLTGDVELLDGATLRAAKILLATGGRVRRLTVDGAGLDGVHYARSAADAEAIREGLLPGARVAIIGGGLIGAEIAASAVQAGCHVTWIEAEARCLTRALAAPLDGIMMRIHRARGVEIRAQSAVSALRGDSKARQVVLADGRIIDADLIVVGIGIEPVTELAHTAGLHVAGGIVVDRFCATSHPNIFAAGDVTVHESDFMDRPGRLEHWRHAQSQGAAAARAMLGIGAPYNELPWFWTDQYDHHIEGCGLPHASDAVVLRGSAEAASLCAFYVRAGRLVAAIALNRPKDVRAAMRLIAGGHAPAAADLADASLDLRQLERGGRHAMA